MCYGDSTAGCMDCNFMLPSILLKKGKRWIEILKYNNLVIPLPTNKFVGENQNPTNGFDARPKHIEPVSTIIVLCFICTPRINNLSIG